MALADSFAGQLPFRRSGLNLSLFRLVAFENPLPLLVVDKPPLHFQANAPVQELEVDLNPRQGSYGSNPL